MKRALIRPNDIIIGIAIVVIAVISVFSFISGEGKYITVSHNGEVVTTMPLNKNSIYTVGDITVTVSDGVAYVSESDCKDKICMRSQLKKSGDCAVCLPNRITITVSGTPDTDAITY